MREKSGVRQALLLSQFAHLYPGIASNVWQPAVAMLDQVNGTLQRRTPEPRGFQHALDPEHFALRGTPSDGAKRIARELRRIGKKRRGPS
ncbi:MAG TPA: hypothetical protein VH700_09025 [Gemmatimonadales bacterium]